MEPSQRHAHLTAVGGSMRRAAATLTAIVVLLASGSSLPLIAGPADESAADYAALLEWQFSDTAAPLPDGGVSFSRDTAEWTLKSGTFRQMRPTAEGAVTGLIFEGSGTFRMTIPDRREAAQLYRYPDFENTDTVELTFSRMVLRTCEGLAAELAGAPPSGGFSPNSLARERHERWLRYARLDVDSRVIAGLLTPDDEYLLVDMEADGPGWVMYEFDALVYEEVSLCRLRDTNDHQEVLVSLDREGERNTDGTPGRARHHRTDVTHVDITASLEEHGGRIGKEIAQSLSTGRTAPWTWINAEVRFKPLTGGARAVTFYLDAFAKVLEVTDGGGNECHFMRDYIGDRFAMVHYNAHDANLVVLFDEPLEKDREYSVTVRYVRQTLNTCSGNAWYPMPYERVSDHHTAKITVLHPDKLQPYGPGTISDPVTVTKNDPVPAGAEELKLGNTYEMTTFTVDEPTLGVAFTYGCGYKEEAVEVEGLPPIHAFGKSDGATIGSVQKNNAADVANSLNFFQYFLDCTLDSDLIRLSRTAGYSNASYENFLIFSWYTYTHESPGLSSLLRGRETAYQLWGHRVNWSSYRDQWLAGALPEYMTMLFIEATMPEEDYFNEILEVYGNEQISSQSSAMSRFATGIEAPDSVSGTLFFSSGINGGFREYEALLTEHFLDYTRWGTRTLAKIGPIAVGFRSSPAEVPIAHTIFNHRRGVMVLHMLRALLKNSPAGKDRDFFREILSTFYRESAGKEVSAEDFINTVERVTQADWDWFFDQWVYGAGLPTLAWSWDTGGKDGNGKYPLQVRISKTNVPADFKVFVPLAFDFGGERRGEILLPVTKDTVAQQIPLPAKPKKVELNPRMSCLAKIEESK